MKIAILSTDTHHHRYFINSIEKEGIQISKYIFETTFIKSKFKKFSFFKNEENNYEKENFFKNVSINLNKKKLIKLKNIMRWMRWLLRPEAVSSFGCHAELCEALRASCHIPVLGGLWP